MNINGSIHSNSNVEANCSIITVDGDCSTVAGAQFNTWQTIIGNVPITPGFIQLPDILSVIKSRLEGGTPELENAWISGYNNEYGIHGENVNINSDIFSSQTIVIDPNYCNAATKDEGIIICSEGDIIIRGTDVDVKGIIYAPNGTVRIESSDFNIQGRIIAKNIVFSGSVFTAEAYDGDLSLLN